MTGFSLILALVAAVGAAAVSYIFNRLSRSRIGRSAIVFVAPGFEESFKTLSALLLGAPVFYTHVFFGGLEAVYDYVVNSSPPAHREDDSSRAEPAPAALAIGRKVGAAAAGLGGHTLFGALTVAVVQWTGYWPFGVGAAYLVHVGWNALVMSRARPGR